MHSVGGRLIGEFTVGTGVGDWMQQGSNSNCPQLVAFVAVAADACVLGGAICSTAF